MSNTAVVVVAAASVPVTLAELAEILPAENNPETVVVAAESVPIILAELADMLSAENGPETARLEVVAIVPLNTPVNVPEKIPEISLSVIVDPLMMTLDNVLILFMSEMAFHKLCTSLS